MKDYDIVEKIVTEKGNKRNLKGIHFPTWSPLTLSHGVPGICLLYGKLMEAFPDEEIWPRIAHNYLTCLVNRIKKESIHSLSMFSGASGIGLSVASVSNNFQNYNKLLNTINNLIKSNYEDYLFEMRFNEGTYSISYDVIEGLSGIMSYLSIFKGEKQVQEMLRQGVEKLIELTNDICIFGNTLPGWYIPSSNQFSDIEKNIYPYGNFNTSFSHGITGPLTILAEMKLNGIAIEGQDEAIYKIVHFLFKFKSSDGKRDYWKGQIDLNEYKEQKLTENNIVRRDAWCYGTPGICYALVVAGRAMENREWIDYGIDNLMKTMADIRGIFSPTFCHGYAGLYQILESVETVTGERIFIKEREVLKEKIMSFYNKNYIWGFRNMEVGDEMGNIKPYNYAGLLDGAVGTCLALLEGEIKSNNLWKRAFVLI